MRAGALGSEPSSALGWDHQHLKTQILPQPHPPPPPGICSGWYFWVGIGSISVPIDIAVSISDGNLLGKLIANYLPSQGKLLHRSQNVTHQQPGGHTGCPGTGRSEAASSSRIQQRMARGGDARKERKKIQLG